MKPRGEGVLAEVGGYPNDRDGVRLGLASVEDEMREALAEWHVEKKSVASSQVPRIRWTCGCIVSNGVVEEGCGDAAGHHAGDAWLWRRTRAEVLQMVAVGMRLLRSMS